MGGLFVVLEKIQEEAVYDNKTIAARSFGSFSTAPKSVFGLLIRIKK
ncbi:type I-C CRISPR-associated protein Cas8c/Csd1 [Neobacillus niacini]